VIKITLKLLVLFFLFTKSSTADLIKPDSNLKPYDVLMIQLNSLKNNNNPYKDAGIEQTWEFAHPMNKAATGPLERFRQMIYSESYKILISHENNKTVVLEESQNKIVYKVYILSKDKKKYYYVWKIERVRKEGTFKNCWMTTSVSDPIYIGEII
tara:strand:- start:493 stop:957 length:465 start_codon:yes stop_codon:yes gene_type:complete